MFKKVAYIVKFQFHEKLQISRPKMDQKGFPDKVDKSRPKKVQISSYFLQSGSKRTGQILHILMCRSEIGFRGHVQTTRTNK